MNENIRPEEPSLLFQPDHWLENSLFFQVIKAQRVTISLLEGFIISRDIPLRIGQLFVFLGVYNLGISTQKEIADYVFRDKAAIQRAIADFQENGLVECSFDRNDKRKKQVSLSEKGERIAHEILIFIKEIETPYADRITSITTHGYSSEIIGSLYP